MLAAAVSRFDKKKLLINLNNSIVEKLPSMDEEKAEKVAKQIYDLARMEAEPLPADDLQNFIKRSIEMLSDLT